MFAYIIRRILIMIPTLLIISATMKILNTDKHFREAFCGGEKEN